MGLDILLQEVVFAKTNPTFAAVRVGLTAPKTTGMLLGSRARTETSQQKGDARLYGSVVEKNIVPSQSFLELQLHTSQLLALAEQFDHLMASFVITADVDWSPTAYIYTPAKPIWRKYKRQLVVGSIAQCP